MICTNSSILVHYFLPIHLEKLGFHQQLYVVEASIYISALERSMDVAAIRSTVYELSVAMLLGRSFTLSGIRLSAVLPQKLLDYISRVGSLQEVV
jgi:hypothetical protein